MSMAASRTIPLDRPEQIDLAQAARYLGARGEPDPATLALLERCASPLLAAAEPRAVYLRAERGQLEALWQGADIQRHLAGCPEAVLMAMTLGPGVDAQIRRAGARRIGLYVTDTFLMLPRKSVTAVLGLSDVPVTGKRAGCAHCALREKCEYRKRGVTCES